MTQRIAVGALAALLVAEAWCFVYWGRPFIDEGQFLAAARLVYEGKLPYRDFPSSQGPTIAYVYGLFTTLFGSNLLVGRIVSFAGFLVTAAAGALLVHRVRGALGAALALVLSMLNLAALWTCNTVTTQALSTTLTVLAALALTSTPRGPARESAPGPLGWALAPSLLLWASGIRLTGGLAFAAVFAWVAIALRRSPRALAAVVAIVGAQALLVFAPFWLAPRAAWFHVASAQLSRSDRGGFHFDGWAQQLAASVAYLRSAETDFFPIVPLAAVVVAALLVAAVRGWRPQGALPLREPRSVQLALVALAALVYAPHLLLEPGYPTYFVTSSVLLGLAIAIGAAGWLARPATGAGLLRVALAIAVGAVAVLGVAREWPTWLNTRRGTFAHLRETGRELQALLGPDCTMVTFQTHLAVEAGCHLLPGLEYSMFSFFTDLDEAEAAERGVLTPELLDERIAQQRPEAIVVSSRFVRKLRAGGRGKRAAEAAGIAGAGTPADWDEWARLLLPAMRRDYVQQGRLMVPSGVRLPLQSGQERAVLYVRRDLLPASVPAAAREAADARLPAPTAIVFVSLDTLRADMLTPYGYTEYPTSPFLDVFARENVLFENSIVQAPHTLPSHMSLFTGLYPPHHGVSERGSLAQAIPTLAMLLRQAGYRTQAFVDGGFLRRRWGFDRGFDGYRDEREGFEGTLPRAEAWLAANRDAKFFLFLHTYDVHSKANAPYYRSPSPYRGMFSAGIDSPLRVDSQRKFEKRWRQLAAAVEPDDVRYVRATYAEGIRYVDEGLRSLFGFLREIGVYERALVVVWSDHGEGLFGHADWSHGELFDHTIRVPLLMKVPGLQARGLRIAAPVSAVDVAPTILDLARVAQRPPMDGQSLVGLLTGAAGAGTAPAYSLFTGNGRSYSARSQSHHFYWDDTAGQGYFYALDADPGEAANLYPSGTAAEAALSASLKHWIEAFDEVAPTHPPAPLDMDDETEQELRALGYVE